jgi:sugar phosphate permease
VCHKSGRGAAEGNGLQPAVDARNFGAYSLRGLARFWMTTPTHGTGKVKTDHAEKIVGNEPAIVTDSFESRTIRKLQIRLIPFLFLLYVIAFVDRINIGFAALTMNKDLGISSQQYGFAFGIFFFGYLLFEVPSNLMLHKFGARVWIARILLSWGLVATLTGLVQNVHQLYMARFLLGLAEAGYFPGIVLYFTYWFRQREHSRCS